MVGTARWLSQFIDRALSASRSFSHSTTLLRTRPRLALPPTPTVRADQPDPRRQCRTKRCFASRERSCQPLAFISVRSMYRPLYAYVDAKVQARERAAELLGQRAHDCLGVAIQLGSVRLLGTFLEDRRGRGIGGPLQRRPARDRRIGRPNGYLRCQRGPLTARAVESRALWISAAD